MQDRREPCRVPDWGKGSGALLHGTVGCIRGEAAWTRGIPLGSIYQFPLAALEPNTVFVSR
ncbi:hypothetical protein BP00DRAFT_427732 [Aspergillus indologenus CBS 114.80]|uniref:Uncharacterized protein n=1 Tax=Aspergillus indologenus CBS 114.80 TaxID=1450541 RepID=A0A2V5I2J8_9EURO|nr:hypothetical protein BP00DRAFT_427732 [Aspergillus indologenus CBS 114.80]